MTINQSCTVEGGIGSGFDGGVIEADLSRHTFGTIVVGGGLAGLETASRLQQGNIDVLLLESRNRNSGRTIRSNKSLESGPAMMEQGAIFVYDTQTRHRLEAAGARVLPFPEECFYQARNGQIELVGEDGGPMGLAEKVGEEISSGTINISMADALEGSKVFQNLSESDQRTVGALFEADLGGSLNSVGLSSLLYDGQTVGKHEGFFGLCTLGGFSTLARELDSQVPTDRKHTSSLVRGLSCSETGDLSLKVRVVKAIDDTHGVFQSDEQSISAESVVLAVPISALASMEFEDPRTGSAVSLISRFRPEVVRALNLMKGADVVKISVKIDAPLVQGIPILHVSVDPPQDGPIRCSSIWGLPVPRYTEEELETNEQVLLMYLGGSQAIDFVDFLERVRGDKNAIADAVSEYLLNNVGLDPGRIVSSVEISTWIAEKGGRLGYSYIACDGESTEFNPRSVFEESVLPNAKLFLAGEAFAAQGSTLTTGALWSGKEVAERLMRFD